MEVFGAFLDQEWESLSNMFSFEDSDFALASAGHGNAAEVIGNNFDFSNNYSNNYYYDNNLFSSCDHAVDQNTHCYFPGRAEGDISFRVADFFHDDEKNNSAFEPMDFIVPAVYSDEAMTTEAEMWCEKLGNAAGPQAAENNGDDSFVGMQLKRKLEAPDNLRECPKKVPRVSREAIKSKRNPRSKKSKNVDADQMISNVDEEVNNNAGGNGQSPSACTSEEGESNEITNGGGSSPESKVSASNGKSKAGKGPATDPQSIYARKRRERINERLKTLQTLVPNGTKVDISTMLEEAVDYVKFLQLQIKLLSSDDMWMFAPIAYNGMDMGLYNKIVPNP